MKQVAHRCCEVSILGARQNLTGHRHEQPGLSGHALSGELQVDNLRGSHSASADRDQKHSQMGSGQSALCAVTSLMPCE